MDRAPADVRRDAGLLWWGRAAVGAVFMIAALDWVGWATGAERLTRLFASWPYMTAWTGVLCAALGAAILLQSGRPSNRRVWAGRALAMAVGVLAVAFLAEYATGWSFGLDTLWFAEATRALQESWPGRPSPQTATAGLLLSIAIANIGVDRRWSPAASTLTLLAAVAIASVAVGAYLFDVVSLARVTQSTGMGISTALGVLLLAAATLLMRPDRNPLAWLLARPDATTLLRLGAVLAGLPVLLGLSRLAFLTVGLNKDAALVLSVLATTGVLGSATFFLSQREQRILIAKEQLANQRVEAEARYHLLADNAVDIIAHLRGTQVVWISPSVEVAFGWPVEQWVGTEFGVRISPDDLDTAVAGMQQVASGKTVTTRLRASTADGGHHWVETRAQPYIDADGNTDGIIAAVRIVDEQVEAERRLRADRQRFEAVARSAPSAISVRDLDDRYTMVNDAFCSLFGRASVEDVLGRTQVEVLPADVLERSQRAAVRLQAGDSFAEEESITHEDKTILVMTQQFPLRDAAGEITELVAIRTDITHRKNAEQAAIERGMWAERVRMAIGDGRLLVYSQPIVDVTTGKQVEEELLVRLRAVDTEEVMAPSEFLPQCEQHGLMPAIDQYMVEKAIELAHVGRRVCVNITGQTIGSATVMGYILEALAAAGPAITDRIAFEITETTAFASLEIAKTFSRKMSALGCRVALDDFGTGYGAFTELRNLALDTLKIDLTFVRDMLEDLEDERIVRTIIFVAQQYGLTTVAEGVESEPVLQKLGELGVDRAQGYLFGKPTPIVWEELPSAGGTPR